MYPRSLGRGNYFARMDIRLGLEDYGEGVGGELWLFNQNLRYTLMQTP